MEVAKAGGDLIANVIAMGRTAFRDVGIGAHRCWTVGHRAFGSDQQHRDRWIAENEQSARTILPRAGGLRGIRKVSRFRGDWF